MSVYKHIDKHTRDGHKALLRGDRARAGTLLRQAVARAPGSEAAWWWLSEATDDPAERQAALARVLALNPEHAEAQAALVALRLQRLPDAPPAAPLPGPAADPWAAVLPTTLLEADDGIDNPYQCPYCGQVTGADDRRCPHCRGALYKRVALSGGSEALRRLQLLLGISLALGVLELAAPLLALGYRQGSATPANFGLLLAFPGVQPFLGAFHDLAPAAIDLLLKALAARTAVYVALILGLRARWRVAYYAAMLAVAADLVFSAYLLVAGYLGWAGLLLMMALTFSAGLLLFAVSYEFAVNHERLLVRPDASARSPLDFYRRGHDYRRQGMWALAVAQWRKAVGLAPREVQYYKHLGVGYAQIGRYDRSLRALREAQRQAPDQSEIEPIIKLVEDKARAGPGVGRQ